MPLLSADAKFNIRLFGTSEKSCLEDEIEARLLEILPENPSGRADFVLGISRPDNEFPWGFDLGEEKSFDIKLQLKINVTEHQKRLGEMKKEITMLKTAALIYGVIFAGVLTRLFVVTKRPWQN